jgi:hypothetical protein
MLEKCVDMNFKVIRSIIMIVFCMPLVDMVSYDYQSLI